MNASAKPCTPIPIGRVAHVTALYLGDRVIVVIDHTVQVACEFIGYTEKLVVIELALW